MVTPPVFMDNHSTTRVDPRVVQAMLPYFDLHYGNAGSTSHVFGWVAKKAVDTARESIARALDCSPREIVFTSGATESNNLAIRGVAQRLHAKGRHLVTVATEHKAVIDPIARLERREFDVTWLPVEPNASPKAGCVTAAQVDAALRPDTILVSVMLANNEIGVIQPLAEIGALCKQRGVLLHCDAVQAVGRMPVRVDQLQVDLLSFSGHKMYGPKGTGGLYVRRRDPLVRLDPQIEGGGQEGGLRSGTLNVPGIVGMAEALRLCVDELDREPARLASLRDRLFQGLKEQIPNVRLNGPPLGDPSLRLPGNLNCSFSFVDGEALMMSMGQLAVSSGSACTSATPEPSHVLRALGLSHDETRSSLRFGLGRFSTEEDVEFAVDCLAEAVLRLRKMSSMAD